MGTFGDAVVSPDVPPVQFRLVRISLRRNSIFLVLESHETEARGLAPPPVAHDVAFFDFAITLEKSGKVFFFGLVAEVEDGQGFGRCW